jgi:hypothetical protein
VRFFIIAHNKLNPFNLSQLLRGTLGIATGGYQHSIGVVAMNHSQPMSGFTVGDMGNGAGIQDIDVSFIIHSYQLIAGISKLPGEKLYLRLIQFTAQTIQGNLWLIFFAH